MCSYTTFEIKVVLCAHTDSKNGIFTSRVYIGYILTRTPSPFSAGWRWGLLSRKFFFIFSDCRFVSQISYFTQLDFKILVSTRCNISLCIFSFTFRFMASIIILDSVFFDSIFRLVFTRWIFTRINFDLFQHCWFYALTLQLFNSLSLLLVINKHLCLFKFGLCLFCLF